MNVTVIGYSIAFGVLYFGLLLALSLRPRERRNTPSDRPFIVLLVPAHNEELVIAHTLDALTTLDYDDYFVLVVNDGSSDETAVLARRFHATGRVLVVERSTGVAGRGKGAVLNHGFEVLNKMVEDGDARLRGYPPQRIVVGVVDADGQVEREALARVATLFSDPRVGGVQTGVRIANAGDSLLTRCQDLDFVGIVHLTQTARDRIGSVGLGGNGQFTRLLALQSLGAQPWTSCLTEDLDLGLSLTERGWRIRFCPDAWVAQQGVRRIDDWLRQRTRWSQGYYQCWSHIPKLAIARHARLVTRLDFCLYLLLVTFVMLVTANWIVTLAGWAGVVTVEDDFLAFLPLGPLQGIAAEVLAFLPVSVYAVRYQRHTIVPLAWWKLPGYVLVFAVYGYLWVVATVWAWGRILCGRRDWRKTTRVQPEASVR